MEKLKEVLAQSFLSSRFWAVLGIAAVGYFKATGQLDATTADALVVILGGFIAVKTSQHFQ